MIWLKVWRSRRQIKNRRALGVVFLLGFLSVVPIVGFQLLTSCAPVEIFGLNIIHFCLPDEWNPLFLAASEKTTAAALGIAFLAVLEEIGKLSIVKYADFGGKRIQTINDALMFSLTAALSFAFVENILYFNNILLRSGSLAALFPVFVFRSAFTAAGHAIFSGIAGYYYGVGKFAKPIVESARWKGENLYISRLLSAIGVPAHSAYRAQLITKGLLIATLAHALFNFLLGKNEILLVILLVIAGVFYIIHLIQRKSGALFLRMTNARPSTMAPQDEEVVLELIGMWINEGKYEEVMGICKRLLERDPDNNVVKLFLAEAHHEKELRRAYKAVKALFTHEDVEFRKGMIETHQSRSGRRLYSPVKKREVEENLGTDKVRPDEEKNENPPSSPPFSPISN